jgi:hypothetical protein
VKGFEYDAIDRRTTINRRKMNTLFGTFCFIASHEFWPTICEHRKRRQGAGAESSAVELVCCWAWLLFVSSGYVEFAPTMIVDHRHTGRARSQPQG